MAFSSSAAVCFGLGAALAAAGSGRTPRAFGGGLLGALEITAFASDEAAAVGCNALAVAFASGEAGEIGWSALAAIPFTAVVFVMILCADA